MTRPATVKNDGRVFLCQPSYAGGHPWSHRAFWIGHTQPGGLCWNRGNVISGGGSLLAMTFNGFWASALNLQAAHDQGAAARALGLTLAANPYPADDGSDYAGMWAEGWHGRPNLQFFGMLHDDIVPESGWADKLLEELLDHDLDMVSCVVPIKDLKGLTSTAIDLPEDEYLIDRRLTMEEVFRLPTTFTAADAGFPDKRLLLNSGCWMCRFDRPWRFEVIEKFGAPFTIRDRMRRLDSGRWTADASSEDWFFSRNLQKLGCRVAATRRVKLEHFGQVGYTNSHPWGDWKVDHGGPQGTVTQRPEIRPAEQLERSPHWHQSQERPEYRSETYADVPGWLTDEEGRVLRALAQGKRVLEIGSYCGRSTLWLAGSAESVVAVDTFDSRYCPTQGSTRAELERNLARHGVANKVDVVKATTVNAVRMLDKTGDAFGLIFVDGSHDYASVRQDIELTLPLLAEDGLMVFHDYGSPTDPGVKQAVDDVFGDDERESLTGYLAVYRPKRVRAAQEALELAAAEN